MSAYICNPAHLGLLAAYAIAGADKNWPLDSVVKKLRCPGLPLEDSAANVAECLALENIRSVQHRYPNDKDGELPGPCLVKDDIITLAKVWARHYLAHFPEAATPVVILSLLSCLDYQSCETDDWKETTAFDQLDSIKSLAIRNLAGYDKAPWDWVEESVPAAIQSFYDTLEAT